MIIAGAKYPEAQRILVAHLDNLLQTEALQNLKNVRCVRLNVYTQTHTHKHTHNIRSATSELARKRRSQPRTSYTSYSLLNNTQ